MPCMALRQPIRRRLEKPPPSWEVRCHCLATYTPATIDLSGQTTAPNADIAMHGARGPPGSILKNLSAWSNLKHETEGSRSSSYAPTLRGPRAPPHHRGSGRGPAECMASCVDRAAFSPAPVGGSPHLRAGCWDPHPRHRRGTPATTRTLSSPCTWLTLQQLAAASSLREKPSSTRTQRA